MAGVELADTTHVQASAHVRAFVEMGLGMLEATARESALATHGVTVKRRSGPLKVTPRWGQSSAEAAGLSRCKPVTMAFADAKWRALKRLLAWRRIPHDEGYAAPKRRGVRVLTDREQPKRRGVRVLTDREQLDMFALLGELTGETAPDLRVRG